MNRPHLPTAKLQKSIPGKPSTLAGSQGRLLEIEDLLVLGS